MRENERYFIDRRDIFGGNNSLFFDVAKQRNLRLDLVRQVTIGAAQKNVGLDSDAEKFLHRMLRWFGLQFTGGGDEGHERYVHKERVLAAEFLTHLPDRLNKRQRFNIAYRAADLHNDEINILRHLFHGVLDLVCDVRNHLHRLAEIITAALFGDDVFVDTAGGPVVIAAQAAVGETLVVPQVEVGLGAIVGNENLAVLERRHGSGIDVEVWIKLLQRDFQSSAFHQTADRSRCQSLAERRHNATGHKDVLCRHSSLCCVDLCSRGRRSIASQNKGAPCAVKAAFSRWSL